MDVTPQVINEVEFHQKMRGYDPDEVDDFLERVAVAVEQFQERVRDAEQRAVAAERRAGEIAERAKGAPPPRPKAAPVNEAEETEAIRRTLVLAQRTADAAIKEAEDEARRTLKGAQDQVQKLYTEAQEHARKLVSDAENEAKKSAEETRQRLINEIVTLEETRDSLRADHGILERHLDEQRLRLRSSIGELQRLLDDPGRLRTANAPDVSGATLPDFVERAPHDEVDAPESKQTAAAPGEPVIDLEAPDARTGDDPLQQRPITGGVTFTPPEEANGSSDVSARSASPRRVAVVGDEDEGSDAWARFAHGEADVAPSGLRATATPTEDAYLDELRKAMLEDTSASTLDPGEHRTRTRFGRRR